MKRKHQRDFGWVIDDIINGATTKTIIVRVTPGGGKSAIPIIAGRLITAGLADAIAWVCPRKALQDQGERNFLDPFFRDMFNHKLTIRTATNDSDPCRGQDGFITTYQAICMDQYRSVLREFSRKRYILVLDEYHHVEEGGIWHRALHSICLKAKYLVLMTGTLERGDGKRIAYTPYVETDKGVQPRLTPDNETAVIQYTRTDALKEGAILPIKFHLSDGSVQWEEGDGSIEDGTLSTRYEKAGRALFTALDTEFGESLLETGVSHWQRTSTGKLLVVTANIGHAQMFTAILKKAGLYAKIATSHESAEALRNIKEFKFCDLNILVTIAMAYEGLDVPAISHIICLTHIRSTPWIEQMLARAVRVWQGAPYTEQIAHIFAPDDTRFRAVVQRIKAEQLPIVKPDSGDGTAREPRDNDGESKEPDFIPIGSEMTGRRELDFGTVPGPPAGFRPPPPHKTVSEVEAELSAEIDGHVNKWSYQNYYKPVRLNGEIKRHFGKGRGEMGVDELKEVLAYVKQAYPLNGQEPTIMAETRPRGRGRRVPAKAEPWKPEQGRLF